MYIKNAWVKEMSQIISLDKPDIDRDLLKKRLEKIFDKRFKDTEAMIYDSYNEEIIDTTLARTLNWIQVEKPYISESGVFFKNRNKARNLNAEIIHGQLLNRTKYKKEMFKAKESVDIIQADFYNSLQRSEKKRANSGYGAEANETSFLYNAHSAMSITAAARGQISIAACCFENLFGDNVLFKNMDECYVYINNIVREAKEWKISCLTYIDRVPTKKEFIDRFIRKFDTGVDINTKFLSSVYDTLPEDWLARVYYKNNFEEFLKNKQVRKLMKEIAFNESGFIDPNKIPEDIKSVVKKFSDVIMEFVGYKYQPFRYENRMKYDSKTTIIVSDTDSTFLQFGHLLHYIMTSIIPYKLFNNKDEKKQFELNIVNTMGVLAGASVRMNLDKYLDAVHVEEEFKKYINMKNEFYLEIVGTTFAMKSYFGILSRQEEFIYETPELEVKGVNFFKSTSTEKTTEFIYNKILLDQILATKDNKIKLPVIMNEINRYERDMANQIRKGDLGYFKKNIKVKNKDAYANPMSISSYKSVYVWNKLVDFEHHIELPSTVVQVKVNIRGIKDLACLESYPEIYEKFVHLITEDKNLQKVNDKGISKFIGINSIALPYGTEEVPDWLLNLVDVNTIVHDNMKLFTQLNKPLGLNPGNNTHNGNSMKLYTNIIKI